MNFSVFHNPTKLIVGKDTVKLIGEEIKNFGIKKVLMTYGRGSIKRNGVYDIVTNSLKENGIEWVELSGIRPNPVLSKVHEGIELARKENVEGILAVGGGSVLDSSKAIAAGFYYNGDIWDAFERKYTPQKALPLFTVLTISATGSEMNGGGVVTNEKIGVKGAFGSKVTYPKVSIVDPTVQYSLPKKQTIYGAIDALTHIFEYYFEVKNINLLNRFAESLIKSIMESTEVLIEDPKNYEHRLQLAMSATWALNGFTALGTNGGDWSSHMIEHSISAMYPDVAHGAGLAVIFPAWAKYVYKENEYKFTRFAKEIFGLNDPLEGIEALINWYKKIGAPTTLRDLGVKEEDIDKLAEISMFYGKLGKVKTLKKEDVKEILKIAF